MSDFERQVQAERARAQQLKAAGEERERRERQSRLDFVSMMESNNIATTPFFKYAETPRERLGLGKILGGRTSYVITEEFTYAGQCWLFAISDYSTHYAVTTDAKIIGVKYATPGEPSKFLKLKLDAEAEKFYRPGAAFLVGGEETTRYESYLVNGARSLLDKQGPIRLHDSN